MQDGKGILLWLVAFDKGCYFLFFFSEREREIERQSDASWQLFSLTKLLVLAKKLANKDFDVPSNRRGFMFLKELAAQRMKVRSFSMLDRNAWTDFMMKLEKLQGIAVHVVYTPYSPSAPDVKDSGFKAFIQVNCFTILPLYANEIQSKTLYFCLLSSLLGRLVTKRSGLSNMETQLFSMRPMEPTQAIYSCMVFRQTCLVAKVRTVANRRWLNRS